ncbi:MAG: hypothetical protein BroJett025_02890 [Patescibacteria group bacterium]|nr:MAG: hypothetical protein BroJett025_02890 [Patescibacteria group bacterium]
MKKILERSEGNLEQTQGNTICGYAAESWLGFDLTQRRAAATVYYRAYGLEKLIEELVKSQKTDKIRGTICGYPAKSWNSVTHTQRQAMASVYALAYGVNMVIEQLTIE